VVEKWWPNVLVPRGIQIVKPVDQPALEHFSYFGTGVQQCREWIINRVESGKNEDAVLCGGPDFNTKIS